MSDLEVKRVKAEADNRRLGYPPGGRYPLLSARPAVTSVAFTHGVTRTR